MVPICGSLVHSLFCPQNVISSAFLLLLIFGHTVHSVFGPPFSLWTPDPSQHLPSPQHGHCFLCAELTPSSARPSLELPPAPQVCSSEVQPSASACLVNGGGTRSQGACLHLGPGPEDLASLLAPTFSSADSGGEDVPSDTILSTQRRNREAESKRTLHEDAFSWEDRASQS